MMSRTRSSPSMSPPHSSRWPLTWPHSLGGSRGAGDEKAPQVEAQARAAGDTNRARPAALRDRVLVGVHQNGLLAVRCRPPCTPRGERWTHRYRGRRGRPAHSVGDDPAVNPLDPDKGLRRLSAKAQRAKAAPWLFKSAGLVQGLIIFIANKNMTGLAIASDELLRLGWGPTIMGLARRIEAALGSNLPPADLEKLSPAVRRLLANLRAQPKKVRGPI
jgi:hypothetical protein